MALGGVTLLIMWLAIGRDHWVPAETSLAYFTALTAPSNKLVWFDESGHGPFVDEPVTFNQAMVDFVRPVADDHDVKGLVATRDFFGSTR